MSGATVMTYLFRPAAVLALGLLVAACGGGGPSLPGSSPAPLPGPPRDLKLEVTSLGHVQLRWDAPIVEPGRAPVTGYAVYLESPDGRAPERLAVTGAFSYRYTGPVPGRGLETGRSYVFHIRAINRIGEGGASESEGVTITERPPLLPPEAPGEFMAEQLETDNEALLTWTAPTPAPERAPVTDYVVYLDRPGGGFPEELGKTESLSFLHTGLSREVNYVYHVRADSERGLSPPSASASVRIAPDATDPHVPQPLSIPHVTARADQGDGTTVTVSWVHDPDPDPQLRSLVTGFQLQYCEVAPNHVEDYCPGDDGWRTRNFGPTTRTHTESVTCDAGDTEMNKARMYRVRAIASNNSFSSRYSVPTRPICPGDEYSPPRRIDAVFDVSDAASTGVNICWNVPEDNSSPLLGYELQSTTGDELPATESGWVIVDAHIEHEEGEEGPVCLLYSGLIVGETYWFRMRAYNLAGHGHWSAPYRHRREAAGASHLPSRAGVQGPGALAVADARASERADAALTFEVTLDRPAPETVTVDYATVDGTATAGEDYDAASGTLELAAGETSKTIAVAVHADTEDEGEETLVLRLSDPSGARIEDGEATGTILDRDPLPREWLARFGRTVAAQAADAVGTRLASKPRTHARVGGVSLESPPAPATLETPGPPMGGPHEPARDPWDGPEEARGLSRHALMSASSFHLASEGDGPVWAAWGRFAAEGFEADVHDTRLDGDTATGFLGADVAGGRWLMGAAVSHSESDGSMAPASGSASARERSDVEITLTGVYPYARMTLSERVSLWGLAGVGQGTLTVSERGRAPAETDIGMNMGALGARGTMLTPSETGGVELALRSDAFWVRMSSDEARTAADGDLADIRTDASRVRLFLEAEREFEVRGEGTLTPSLEVGVRRDGGDAETGTGFEAGAGMRYAAKGIAIEGAVRRLVVHEDGGYREWGAAGSVRIDPGASGRGLSLTLAPAFGAGPSDAERPWSLGDARGLAGDAGTGAGSRLEAEVGYGWWLPTAVRGMLTPYTGLSFSDRGTRAWRLGARLMMTRDISFGLEGTRREHRDDVSDQSVVLHGRLHW